MTTPQLLESLAGRRSLERAAQEHWLMAFDFDGTLAPFVADPLMAAIPSLVYADLALLASRRQVAIITGRSRDDVMPRLPPGIAYVVGNHGCEQPGGDPSALLAATEIAKCWRETLRPMIEENGLRLESKGPSLALHWRGLPKAESLAAQAAHCAMRLMPRPRLVAGDQVLNLLPAGLPDKGDALLHLIKLSGRPGALFVGDDITDAAVFRLRDPGILGIEVGNKGLGADWKVEDTVAVARMIKDLITFTQAHEGLCHV